MLQSYAIILLILSLDDELHALLRELHRLTATIIIPSNLLCMESLPWRVPTAYYCTMRTVEYRPLNEVPPTDNLTEADDRTGARICF